MNYLELTQRLQQEAGIAGTPLTTTQGQIGELKRICDWVRYAWDEIQVERRDWNFLWAEFQVALAQIGQDTFTINTGLPGRSIWNAETFYLEDPTQAFSRRPISVLENNYFNNLYGGRIRPSLVPNVCTFLPNNQLRFNCPIDRLYNFGGWYIKPGTSLINDTDIPGLDSSFHLAILYRAMLKYAMFEEDERLISIAAANDIKWSDILVREALPRMAIGASSLGPAYGFSTFVWPG